MKSSLHVGFNAFIISFVCLCGFEWSAIVNPFDRVLPFLEKSWSPLVPLINTSSIATAAIHSDSTGQYILALLCLAVSVLVALVHRIVSHKGCVKDASAVHFNILLCRYMLALFLGIYGTNKVLHWQFARPEPNLLYTPTGMHSKAMLFWISMGSSWLYQTVTGWIELSTAALLLHRRTIKWGSLMALMIMTHVFLLNMSFDISVKLFSAFLLALALRLYACTREQASDAALDTPRFFSKQKWLKALLVAAMMWMVFGTVVHNALRGDAIDGHCAGRPALHGAYALTKIADVNGNAPIAWEQFEKVFIHKDHFILFARADGESQCFRLLQDAKSNLALCDDQGNTTAYWRFEQKEETVLIFDGERCIMAWTQLPWEQMPLLQDEQHLFMDSD